jgi:hypothetical protein
MKTARDQSGVAWGAAVFAALLVSSCAGTAPNRGAPAERNLVFGVSARADEDPLAAGRTAAAAAKARIGDAPIKAVLVSECYEDRDRKAKVLEGVCSIFDNRLVYGQATYGSFTQAGVAGGESVAVLAIAGEDIAVAAACQRDMGASKLTMADHHAQIEERLTAAGKALARQLPRDEKTRLLIVFADAHSPKNGYLVSGLQEMWGKACPITGGCANKNAGQTFVYYQGEMLTDAAVGLRLSGDFAIAMAGRQAKENDQVIATAGEASRQAVEKLSRQGARPAVVLAFDCAGRKGKLKNVADALSAIQKADGTSLVLMGTYNAGEIGPADVSEARPGVLSSGVGWHVMVTAIGR